MSRHCDMPLLWLQQQQIAPLIPMRQTKAHTSTDAPKTAISPKVSDTSTTAAATRAPLDHCCCDPKNHLLAYFSPKQPMQHRRHAHGYNHPPNSLRHSPMGRASNTQYPATAAFLPSTTFTPGSADPVSLDCPGYWASRGAKPPATETTRPQTP